MKIRSVGKAKGVKKRYVYGTKTNKWYLVGKSDRDFKDGLSLAEFKRLGQEKAKEKYLSPKVIREIVDEGEKAYPDVPKGVKKFKTYVWDDGVRRKKRPPVRKSTEAGGLL